jgi:WD40 repeat protein
LGGWSPAKPRITKTTKTNLSRRIREWTKDIMRNRLFLIFMLSFPFCVFFISCDESPAIESTSSPPREIIVTQTGTATNTPTDAPNVNTIWFYPYSTETAAVASSIGYGTPHAASGPPIRPDNVASLSMVISWPKEHVLDWVFTPDSKYLIALGPGHTPSDSWWIGRQVVFYNLETNAQERSFPLYYDSGLLNSGKANGENNFNTYGSALAISPDGTRLAVSLDYPVSIALYDLQGNLLRQQKRPEIYAVTHDYPDSDELFYSADGDYIIWRSLCDIFVFDANSLEMISSMEPYTAQTIAVSTTGILAAFTYSSAFDLAMKPSEIFLWNIPDANAVRTITTSRSIASSADFSPDGKYLAIGTSMDGVEIWQMPEAKYMTTLHVHPNEPTKQGTAANVLFSPDGSLLFVYFGGQKTFWNTQSWSLISMEWIMTVSDFAFTPNGKLFISKNNEGVLFYAVQ